MSIEVSKNNIGIAPDGGAVFFLTPWRLARKLVS